MDLLIVNGAYPDFEKNELVSANIGIKDGKIAYIGQEHIKSKEVVDAKGNIVSPGFIDIHMHEENLTEGRYYQISDYMLKMGVTTCLGGNCGNARQPIKEYKDFIKENGGAPVDFMMLAGYNSIRLEVGVDRYKEATKEEQEKIHILLKKELEEGALGISLGLEYSPGITFEEALAGIMVSDDENLFVTAHYRKDAGKAIESIHEMIELGKKSGKKMQIAHLSSCSAMGQMKEALEIIEKGIKENPKLNFDMYPYAAFAAGIGTAVFDEGCLEEWNKDYCDIMLTEVPYKNIRCTKEIFEDARRNYPSMLAVAFVMNEEEITLALQNKYGMIGSDGVVSKGKGHPRAAGTFPRVLRKYVREENSITMIEALNKMTREPAKRLELTGKGEIKLGYHGDIIIFDPLKIADGAEFSSLEPPNQGINKVYIKGKLALDNGQITNGRLGKFIEYKDK